MKVEYDNFIGLYSEVYPEGYCEHLISEFDRLSESGAGYNRQQTERASKHAKNDLQLNLNFAHQSAAPFNGVNVVDVFFNGLQKCYDMYAEEFSILKESHIKGSHMKMQRTSPGGGYHIWHSEQNNGPQASRGLVYMLYLNTLEAEEAGETEFLYQQKRYKPTQNCMLIWPASFTHTHRGNTVFNTNKYIVTGWFHYED